MSQQAVAIDTEEYELTDSEKFLHKMLLLARFKQEFINNHEVAFYITRPTSITRKVYDWIAMRFAAKKAVKMIEENGYDVEDLPDYSLNYCLYYSKKHGVRLSDPEPGVIEYTYTNDPIVFYNAPRYGEDIAIYCDAIHEDMYELIEEKFGFADADILK